MPDYIQKKRIKICYSSFSFFLLWLPAILTLCFTYLCCLFHSISLPAALRLFSHYDDQSGLAGPCAVCNIVVCIITAGLSRIDIRLYTQVPFHIRTDIISRRVKGIPGFQVNEIRRQRNLDRLGSPVKNFNLCRQIRRPASTVRHAKFYRIRSRSRIGNRTVQGVFN